MKIALPVWKNKVSPVLDAATRLMVVEMHEGEVVSSVEAFLGHPEIPEKCFQIRQSGIEVLICGAITRKFQGMLQSAGIRVISGITGNSQEVISAFVNGTLESPQFLLPGSRKTD